jgi:hypothetical protein
MEKELSKYSSTKKVEKINKKRDGKKKKKDDRNVKIQEQKRQRVKQKREKKLVSDMIEVLKEIYPFFTANAYFRKYFNLSQFFKLEMFSELQIVKDEYKGENSVFTPVIISLLEKIYNLINPRMTVTRCNMVDPHHRIEKEAKLPSRMTVATKSEFISSEMETHKDKFDELMILYVKG